MIEIPRDKVLGIAGNVNDLVSTNNQSGDSWVRIARDIFEALPQAKKVWDDIKTTVSQTQAEPKHIPTIPNYDEAPKKNLEEKIKVVDNYQRAENIFDELIRQGEKNKIFFAGMKGATLFEMLKGKKEMVVGKIAEELER